MRGDALLLPALLGVATRDLGTVRAPHARDESLVATGESDLRMGEIYLLARRLAATPSSVYPTGLGAVIDVHWRSRLWSSYGWRALSGRR
jgi:hypothetical protein